MYENKEKAQSGLDRDAAKMISKANWSKLKSLDLSTYPFRQKWMD